MNDKEYEQQKNRVKKLLDKWRTPLGLGWWRVTLEYSREKSRGEDTPSEHNADVNGTWDVIFSTRSDFHYKVATITAFLPIIKDINDEDMERYFLHECMHILVTPMKHKDKGPQEELVATTLADTILWVVEGTKKKKL